MPLTMLAGRPATHASRCPTAWSQSPTLSGPPYLSSLLATADTRSATPGLGTIIGCLRKLQGWNLTSILEEYRRHAGPKIRLVNEQVLP